MPGSKPGTPASFLADPRAPVAWTADGFSAPEGFVFHHLNASKETDPVAPANAGPSIRSTTNDFPTAPPGGVELPLDRFSDTCRSGQLKRLPHDLAVPRSAPSC